MRLVLLILFLFCGQALAVPVIGLAASAIGGTAITIGTVAISWGTVIFTAASLLYGAATQRKQKKDAAAAAQRQIDSFNASLRDRTISGVATEFPYRFIYGVDRVGVNTVAVFTTGSIDQLKHLVCQFAACETTAVDEVYVNGKSVGPLNVAGYPVGGTFLRNDTQHASESFPTSTATLSNSNASPNNMSAIGLYLDDDGHQNSITLPFTFD